MGTYSTNFKLYKPDSSEGVNVDQQLNGNLDIADFNAKGLLEYEKYTSQVIGIDSATLGTRKAGHRFYKTATNSLWVSTGPAGVPSQDVNANVDTWHDASNLISTTSGTWQQYTGQPCGYRTTTQNGNTTVEWNGRLWLGGTALTAKNNYAPVLDLSVAFHNVTPVVNKYFFVYGGNTTSGYATCRIIFVTTSTMEVYKMGTGTATSSSENYVDLGGVSYNVEVTGT